MEGMFNSFYRLPRAFFTNKRFGGISTDAKILYSILLDRMCLSDTNGWYDEKGRIYIYYPVSQASDLLGFCEDKIRKLFKEIEDADLIERKRQGLCKAYKIYLRTPEEIGFQNGKKSCSKPRKNQASEHDNSVVNYTEYNQTEKSYTESSIMEIDADEIEEQVKLSMEYDILSERVDRDILKEIISIVTEIMCCREPIIRIGGKDQPRSLVHKRMMSLRCEHIEYVLECMKKNSARIRDIKAYMISALFNAPATMDNYYLAEVRADFS